MQESLLGKLCRHLRTAGLMATLAVIAKNLHRRLDHAWQKRFDRRLGIDTTGCLTLDALAIDSPNKASGVHYEPTPPQVLRHVFSRLRLHFEDYEFVDFGCGKGRVLVLAARYPFKRVVGVEFAPELAEVARRNIANYHDDRRRCEQIDIVLSDAAAFEMPAGPAILYLFNPFDATVVRRIADNLVRSVEQHKTTKYVIYYNPLNEAVFGNLSCLEKVAVERRIFDFSSLRFRGYTVFRTLDTAEAVSI